MCMEQKYSRSTPLIEIIRITNSHVSTFALLSYALCENSQTVKVNLQNAVSVATGLVFRFLGILRVSTRCDNYLSGEKTVDYNQMRLKNLNYLHIKILAGSFVSES
jgi:hypothetical protein